MLKHLDMSSIVVILVTLALFIAALFTKRFTQDLLLEAGVFLVSVKLIMMAYSSKQNYLDIARKYESLKELLEEVRDRLKEQK